MKVLFILDDRTLHQEPLGVISLSASMQLAGHEAEAINGEAAGEGLVEEVRARSPHLIAFSSTTGPHKLHLEQARLIKAELDVFAIMGNAHPSFFPEVLEEADCLDFICRGEGDEALIELLDALEKGGDPTGIPNIDAKVNGKVHRNPLRPFIQDLDALPYPDRMLTRHLNDYFVDGTSHFITGRGCPYNCSYCFNHTLRKMADGRYVRRRSVENVMRELEAVRRLNRPRMMNFQDDTFILNRRWLQEFTERYRTEIGLPYLCHVRADLVKEDVVEWLASSNCVMVCIGVEAGNAYLRNKVLRRNLSSEQIIRACHILRDHGIDVLTQNMVGIPHETVKTFWETLELNRACDAAVVQFNLFRPLPDTDITQMAIDNSFFDGDYGHVQESFYDGGMGLELPEKAELEATAAYANLIVDSKLVRSATRALCLLPRNNRFKLRAMGWLARHQGGIRRRLGCRDSRWCSLSRYWADVDETPDGKASLAQGKPLMDGA